MERATRIRRGRAEHELAKDVLQTEHGLQKTEKERESGGWARTRRVQSWI